MRFSLRSLRAGNFVPARCYFFRACFALGWDGSLIEDIDNRPRSRELFGTTANSTCNTRSPGKSRGRQLGDVGSGITRCRIISSASLRSPFMTIHGSIQLTASIIAPQSTRIFSHSRICEG